jgi:hypothetical protein
MKQRALSIFVFIFSLLLATLACNAPISDISRPSAGTVNSQSESTAGQPDFRYDKIPEKDNLSQAMAQFQAIRKWSC